MKAKFLKMAGVKTEKAFYKKFPTEKAFMAKYGASIKKARVGKKLKKNKKGELIEIPKAFWGALIPLAAKAVGAIGAVGGAGAAGGVAGAAGAGGAAASGGGGLMSMMGGGGAGGGNMMKMATQMMGQQGQGQQQVQPTQQTWGQDIQVPEGASRPAEKPGFGELMAKGIPILGKATGIYRGFKAHNEKKHQAQQINQITEADLMAKNSDRSREELAENRQQHQVNPWDNVINPENRIPGQVGTNVLTKYGKTFKKNGGKMKYQQGGLMNLAKNDKFGNLVEQGVNTWTNGSPGGQVGSEIADMTGMKKLPGGKFAAGILQAGTHLAFSQGTENKINKQYMQAAGNIDEMSGIEFGDMIQSQNSAFSKYGSKIKGYADGGTMKYADGGEIQIQGEGSLTPISENPYGGEMHKINGPSHKDGGTMVNVMGQNIEAEPEPIYDTSEGDKVIAGARIVPISTKKSAETFTGEKFSGKQFKHVLTSVGKSENKQTKIKDLNVDKADKYTPLRPLDRISLNTLKTNTDIADDKLMKLQIVKDGLAEVQEAINIEEGENARYGKKFRKKAQKGITEPDPVFKDIETAKKSGYEPFEENGKTRYRKLIKEGEPGYSGTLYSPDEVVEPIGGEQVDNSYKVKGGKSDVSVEGILNNSKKYKTFHSRMTGASDDERRAAAVKLHKEGVMPSQYQKTIGEIEDPTYSEENYDIPGTEDEYGYATIGDGNTEDPKKKFPWLDLANQIPGMFKKSDADAFDNRQLIPEMFALSNNQLEPVEAQKYKPRLDVPYDISYQDALNRNRSNARSAERLAQYNPGMLANLKGQEYQADQKVLADQFRANQAKKDQVYSGNRKILNDADLKNLAIMDQQYVRQSQAKSNTKATTQSALSSISDKRAKHSLENKTLRVWENMYDYRYDNRYRTNYLGDPLNVDAMQSMADANSGRSSGQPPEGMKIIGYDAERRPKYGYKTKTDLEASGGIKNFSAKNGMLVKSYKKFK